MLKRMLLFAANLTAAKTSSTDVASNLKLGRFFSPLAATFSTSGIACCHNEGAGHAKSVARILQALGPAGTACDVANEKNNERMTDFIMKTKV